MRIATNFGVLVLGTGVTISSAVGQLPNQGQQPASTSPYPAVNDPLSGGMSGEKGASSGDTMGHAVAAQMDKRFLQEVTEASLLDIDMGKMAAEKGSSPAVKQFGEKMVIDHKRAVEILKRVAARDSVDVPSSIDPKHKERLDKLAKLSGPEFDRAYIKDQLKAHQRMVSYFQKESDDGTETSAKKLATNMLPSIQQHYDAVKELNKSVSATAMK